jgi:uncharacterized Zn-binding protein involved in type VI secretion
MSVMMGALRESVSKSVAQARQAVPGGIAAMGQTAQAAIQPAVDVVKNLDHPLGDPPNPARAVLGVVGAVTSAMSLPMELLNTGIAAVTNVAAAFLPSFPAAQLGSLYVGAPHAHLHPPSFVPPASPIPLPTMGAITLGTCVKVLVGGMPAARVGDLGMAPTCGGIAPFFTVFLGSSKVFIGGARAARQTDMCTTCTPSTATALSKMEVAMSTIGMVADLTDLAAEENAAMAGATALGVAMNAAQMAADAVASAMSATMGTDPAVPPALPGYIMMGAPTVLVAGVPVPATSDIAKWLKNKLKGALKALSKKGKGKQSASKGGPIGCPGKK